MGIRELFSRVTGGRSETWYECRACGTTLPADAEACPACGRTEIASYEW